jgi:glycosyltransferase involved in cell wall biosynthesis
MKILLINRNHFIGGGADRVYLNTGKLLEENGHSVAFFSTINENNIFSNEKEYFVKNINTRNISLCYKVRSVKKYLYNDEASNNLTLLLEDFKPDVAHIHLFYGVLSASVLKTLSDLNIPIVSTIHDYRLLCPTNAMVDNNGRICEKCKNDNFYNCILKRCSEGNIFQSSVVATEAYLRKLFFDPLVLVNHFIFVSEFSKNKHISFDERYIKKSTHLYNFSSTQETELKKIKGDYLFYFGRLSKEKGILNLINASKKTNSNLKIAGDGPQRNQIIESIRGFANIEYVGFQTGLNLRNFIMKSSFVVVPSEWYENNPMTVVESFSNGKPVIGSNIGGIPELVDQKTGFIFEPGNLDSLISSIKLSERLTQEQYSAISENCEYSAIKHFSKQVHLKSLLNIYQKVLNENKRIN